MKLVGANSSVRLTGIEELPGKSNYFIGNDPKKWRTNLPNFAKVRYRRIYSGIDLLFYGNPRQLEYDFVVSPGADPEAITLALQGAEKLQLDAQGYLVIHVAGGKLRMSKPQVFQEAGGARQSREGYFVLKGKREVGFRVAAYDAGKPLMIDPALSYSTYLGGSSADSGFGIAVDSSGSAYVTGSTASTNFPTASPIQAANGGDSDAFVTKLNAAGSALVYSTYLGGTGFDEGLGIAVDSSGNAHVTGYTTSPNFPITSGTFQTTYGGNGDAFVTQMNAAGSALLYSSYLGGSDADFGQGIAVDASGNTYVTGSTASANFPTANALQASNAGASDAFLTKVNSAGSALVYSTYLGGGGADSGRGIAVDSTGNAYVTGNTLSTNFPTASPLQAANGGSLDAFVAKLNAAGSALLYSTYLGGSGFDSGMGIAVDSSGNATVAGYTSSTNFPTATPIQANFGGGLYDAFVTKLNAAGSALVFSTYLGGTDTDQGFAIAVDSSGNVYVTGYSQSSDFPTARPVQSNLGGGSCGPNPCSDAFVTVLNAAGSSLVYSTYLGGNDADSGQGIAADSSGNAYLTGITASLNFPVTSGVFQAAYGGTASSGDAFITKISPADAPAVTLSPQSLSFGNQATGTTSAPQNVTLTDSGSAALAISSIGASGDFAQTNTCGTSLAAGGANCTISVTFSPTTTGSRTGTVTIADDAAGSPQVVNLSGTGITPAPDVTLSPSSLDFGDQPFGTTSAPQTVTLANSGSATLTITSIATAADFAETNNCPPSLDPGSNCTISLAFTPKSTGRRLGDLTVKDNAKSSPQMVKLSGNGNPLYSLSSNSTSVTFNRGTSSTTFTISAAGPTTLTNSIKLACSGSGQAACGFNPTSINLGQSSTLTVSNLSAVFGNSLTFTVNGTSGSETASLSLTITFLDFSLSAYPPSHTVTAGNSATYTLNIAPINGFTGATSLSCSGGPKDVTCTISPNSVTLDGSSTSTATVTVKTTARSMVPPPSRPRPWLFWFLGSALLAGLAQAWRRRAPAVTASLGVIVLCGVLLSVSCNEFFVPIIHGTAEGPFSLTITAKSGSLSHSVPVTLTVL